MTKKLLLILLFFSYGCISKDRTIAIIAYGSLVNEPIRGEHELKIKMPFQAANFTLPISLRRHSGMGTENERITAVIDKSQGQAKAIYFATMDFPTIKAARENLSMREGSKGQLSHIYYLKKNLPDLATEKPVPNAPDWYIKKPQGESDYLRDVQLSDEDAKMLADWAASKGYDAVIWASYPPNMASEKDVAQKLISAGVNSNLYKNTVAYINQLPNKAETNFEKAVVSGPEALKKEYGID